jgi:hypothetical protein
VSALPRVFCLNATLLAAAEEGVASGDDALDPALDALLEQAQAALDIEPTSVMDKAQVPPSGDKHDYMSYGPYWWPDPDQPDGLPYIRRDGEVNPEARTDASDRVALGTMASAVDTLALAHYFGGEEAFASHAAKLLRTWFLAPETRMNPHLKYGQAIPGRVAGRGIGIIDTARLAALVDSIGLLGGSAAWSDDDLSGMVAWFDGYLHWLRHSQHGQDEDQTLNNHGTWYDVQVSSFALFTEKREIAVQTLEASKQRRIAAQIEPDGRQPHELRRTKALGYSLMNLRGMFQLAEMGQQIGTDLWHFQTGDGRGIRAALDYLAPYADPSHEWPYPQIEPLDRVRLFPLLRRAAIAYDEPAYELQAKQLPPGEVAQDRAQLLYPLTLR